MANDDEEIDEWLEAAEDAAEDVDETLEETGSADAWGDNTGRRVEGNHGGESGVIRGTFGGGDEKMTKEDMREAVQAAQQHPDVSDSRRALTLLEAIRNGKKDPAMFDMDKVKVRNTDKDRFMKMARNAVEEEYKSKIGKAAGIAEELEKQASQQRGGMWNKGRWFEDEEIEKWLQRMGYGPREAENVLRDFLADDINSQTEAHIPTDFKRRLRADDPEDFVERVVKVAENLVEEDYQETGGEYYESVTYDDIQEAAEIFRQQGVNERAAEQGLWAMYANNVQNFDWNPYLYAGLEPDQFVDVDEDTYRGWVEKAMEKAYPTRAQQAGRDYQQAKNDLSSSEGAAIVSSLGRFIIGAPLIAVIGFLLYVTFGTSLIYTVVIVGSIMALYSAFYVSNEELAELEAALITPLLILSSGGVLLNLGRSEIGAGLIVMSFGTVSSIVFIVNHLEETESEMEDFLGAAIEFYLPESQDPFLKHEWAIIVALGGVIIPFQFLMGSSIFAYLYLSLIAPVSMYFMIRDDMAKNAMSAAKTGAVTEAEKRGIKSVEGELTDTENDMNRAKQEIGKLVDGGEQPESIWEITEPRYSMYALLTIIEEEMEEEGDAADTNEIDQLIQVVDDINELIDMNAGEIKHSNPDDVADRIREAIAETKHLKDQIIRYRDDVTARASIRNEVNRYEEWIRKIEEFSRSFL